MMVLPELLVSTSILSIALLLWGVIGSWWKEECRIPVAVVQGVQRLEVKKKEEEEADVEDEEASSSTSSEVGCFEPGQERGDEEATPQSSSPGSPRQTLTRRQRKNRKEKEKVEPAAEGSKTKGLKKQVRPSPPMTRRNSEDKIDPSLGSRSKKRSVPCKQYGKLGAEDHHIYEYFNSYLLPNEQMRQLGFPQNSSLYPGKAYIYRDPDFCTIFPDGNSSELDDGEFLEEEEKEGKSGMDPSAPAFQPREVIEDVTTEEGEEEWCFLGQGSAGWEGSESGGSSFKGDGSHESSEKRGAVRGVDELQLRSGSIEDGHTDLKTEDAGISLNATAKEFVPGGFNLGASSLPLLSQTVSAPNLLRSSNSPVPNIDDIRTQGDARSENSNTSKNGCEVESEKASDIVEKRRMRSSPDLHQEGAVLRQERRCGRCGKNFVPGRSGETCGYHWGKLRARGKADAHYSCCGARVTSRQSQGSKGCSFAPCHVWSGLPTTGGIFGPLEGFVRTKHRKSYPANGNFGVYGIDCEMCYTVAGLELTKVTVVGVDGRLVYESLVLPDNQVADYNTRFSGITKKDLENGPTKNLKEVQNDLMGFINADTILVGHGLENDLRALQLVHSVVLDTSAVFPHYCGLPYRRSLRSLVSSYLKREIQSSWGHDSYEDARACVDLMLWKARKDGCGRRTAVVKT